MACAVCFMIHSGDCPVDPPSGAAGGEPVPCACQGQLRMIDAVTAQEPFRVECSACLRSGPTAESRVAAIAAWNRRAPAPSQAPPEPELPPDMLAVLRDPSIYLGETEHRAANLALAYACKSCLRADHPYWHLAGSPCLRPATAAPSQPLDDHEAERATLAAVRADATRAEHARIVARLREAAAAFAVGGGAPLLACTAADLIDDEGPAASPPDAGKERG